MENSNTKKKKTGTGNTSVHKIDPNIYETFYKTLPAEKLKAVKAYRAFTELSKSEKVTKARKIIQEAIIECKTKPDELFSLAVTESESLLKGYTTLDEVHRSEIVKLISSIKTYLNDSTRKRPLNALMLASPGAGKSHFINMLCLAMKKERVHAVTFNMATMRSADDMAQPVDELRNLKINDKFPLLFLDEFDSNPTYYPALLPLLWDGELHIGHRDLKLGKAVIVLAGSNPDLPKEMEKSASMSIVIDHSSDNSSTNKLVDLLSRINGGIINIPDLDLRTENRDRRVDKICITISLLKRRFGDELNIVPRPLLGFIALTNFRYGVRSIAHLIDLIDSNSFKNKQILLNDLRLPLSSEIELKESSLKLHLIDKDQAFGIVNRWKELSKDQHTVSLGSQDNLLNILHFLNYSIDFKAENSKD
jgi:hypothetical protein